nr:DCC1-like thiol-disulfide oxidoreductase family protein [Sphingomonas bacterium]
MDDNGPIILFDALCVLCSANAQFILRHDRHRRFRLASIQGEVGRELCRRHRIDPDDPIRSSSSTV